MNSIRGYISSKEQLERLANITVTDEEEMWNQISYAEAMIDAWVGPQEKANEGRVMGVVSAVSGATIYDTNGTSALFVTNNSYQGCTIEIVGGTGAGQSGLIASSDRDARSVTLHTEFSVAPDTTSVFKIYQLAKFPRHCDVTVAPGGTQLYKTIPEAVASAVAYQVEFIIEMGEKYFAGDGSEVDSETIGNYSYSRGSGSNAQSSLVRLLSPRSRALLRSIKNRKGRLIA